jgi:hypothetical protein
MARTASTERAGAESRTYGSASLDRAREAAAQFEAVLLSATLAPLGKSLGFFGEVALNQLALTIARRDRALTATFERLFER